METKVISANRLEDGIVVYITKDNNWSECISDAEVFNDEAACDEALSKAYTAEEACIVVSSYLIDIEQQGEQYNPTKYREFIRVIGPTVRPDLARQVRS